MNGYSFPIVLSVDGSGETWTDLADLARSVIALVVLSNTGDWINQPGLGVDAEDSTFAPTGVASFGLKQRIYTALSTYLPEGVNLIDIAITSIEDVNLEEVDTAYMPKGRDVGSTVVIVIRFSVGDIVQDMVAAL